MRELDFSMLAGMIYDFENRKRGYGQALLFDLFSVPDRSLLSNSFSVL